MVIPQWLYRLAMSLWPDMHTLAMLLVAKQLRRTVMQIDRSLYDDPDEGHTSCCSRISAYSRYAIDVFVYVMIVVDLVVAVLDGMHLAPDIATPIMVLLQACYFAGMGYLFSKQARVAVPSSTSPSLVTYPPAVPFSTSPPHHPLPRVPSSPPPRARG